MKVSLQYTTTYHPQTDGQSERVNQCLENYLRCMVILEPKKWLAWLPLAEWWYNTNYHTSLKCTPFEALYGYKPPMISEVLVPGPDTVATDFLSQRQDMIKRLKENLIQAHERMKRFADNKRTERTFEVGDMVYLRLQPFKHNAFNLHQSLKLTTKYYGPFRVLEKVGPAAYKIQLSATADIHSIFHVSQLKKHLGPRAIPQANLPLITPNSYVKTEPLEVLDTRAIPRRDDTITQWKIQ
jgi:hypothetical protein